MKRFILALAALLCAAFAFGGSAFASNLHPFGKGYKDNHELAQAMRKAYERDPTGRTPIRQNCTMQTGCGSLDFYRLMFQKDDKAFNVDNAHLADYVDTLELRDAPPGNHWMAGITGSDPLHMSVVWDALSRPFKVYPDGRKEKAWVDPKTGKPKLAADCTNPVGEPDVPVAKIEAPCDFHKFEMLPGDEIHIAKLGGKVEDPKHCLALMKAGEDEWETTLLNDCPHDCNFAGPARFLHLQVQPAPRISFKAQTAGMNTLRVPQGSEVWVYCLVRAGGTKSCGEAIYARNIYQHEVDIVYDASHARWSNRAHVWTFNRQVDCPTDSD